MADFTADQLRAMARSGVAMPDTSFPVPDAEHLNKAIHAVPLGSNNSSTAIRKHIMGRAKALNLTAQIPSTWKADGTIQKAEEVTKTESVPIWKDDAQHIVYGVALTPDVEDSQGDIVTSEDIEKAAHAWLAEFRKHDVQHSGVDADIVPVESFLAPVDFEVVNADGEKQTVLKGSWVIASRVNDPDAWDRVQKRELTGWSITGSGVREPIPLA